MLKVKKVIRWSTILLLLFTDLFCRLGCLSVAAQENYEIQVYASELVRSGHTMFELHSNYTLKRLPDSDFFTENFFRETLEITHGFGRWMELGSYLFTNIGTQGSSDFVGVHLRPRFAVPEEYKLPLGFSISSEFGYARKEYSYPQWTLEIRPIVDKKLNRFFLALNTVFSWGFSVEYTQKAEFGSAFKASYDATRKVAFGIEYYGGYGAITGFLPHDQQQHQLFGSIDLDFGPEWEFNSGLGWSLNEATDRLIIKFILGRRFGF
jgi:hypothetical protein